MIINSSVSFKSKAPTRIDLAGGTIDIWPLYAFLQTPMTVNLAIDLFAEAKVEEISQEGVVLEASDQNVSIKLGWEELRKAKVPPALDLHHKLLKHFLDEKTKSTGLKPSTGLKLSTLARSPAGAGLGGSSAISVAIIGVLANWVRGSFDQERDGERLIQITRDIETTVIQVPAGVQDYYAAMFGGLQSLNWRAEMHEHRRLSRESLASLEKRLLLFYSGHSRNSGINNWALFKSFIDTPKEVRPKFQEIADSAVQLEKAINAQDWNVAAEAINNDWRVRSSLAKAITTDSIDKAFDTANRITKVAGKVCGAGGGGCFFIFMPNDDNSLRERIRVEISKIEGIQTLPFKAVAHGLEVQ